MKRLVFIVLTLMLSAGLFVSLEANSSVKAQAKEIQYFYGQGCSHCARVSQFVEDNSITQNYPIKKYEVYYDRDNAVLYNETMDSLNIDAANRGVPAMVFGQEVLFGDTPIIENFYTYAERYLQQSGAQETEQQNTPAVETKESKVSIPVIVGASLVDAVNPCAFAVLFILLTAVLLKDDRRRALLSGLAFSGAIFISYFLMGLGVYKALGSLQTTSLITNIVGVLAIVLGLFNLKDWLWYGKFFKVEVPQAWRPKMRQLITSATSPVGAFGVGFLVSLFLLPCTSGPYIVVLGLLAENPFDAGAIGYLLLYNAIFVLPMLLITLLAYRGLNVEKAEYYRQANIERLHLIAGIILLALGIFVLL